MFKMGFSTKLILVYISKKNAFLIRVRMNLNNPNIVPLKNEPCVAC